MHARWLHWGEKPVTCWGLKLCWVSVVWVGLCFRVVLRSPGSVKAPPHPPLMGTVRPAAPTPSLPPKVLAIILALVSVSRGVGQPPPSCSEPRDCFQSTTAVQHRTVSIQMCSLRLSPHSTSFQDCIGAYNTKECILSCGLLATADRVWHTAVAELPAAPLVTGALIAVSD